MKSSSTKIRPATERSHFPREAWLCGLSPDGRVWARFDPNAKPQAVLLACDAPTRGWRAAVESNARVLISFIEGDPARPVVTGLIVERVTSEPASAGELADRLEIRAGESIRLVCGSARLELSRDGTVRVSGSDIKTLSTGTTQVDGAEVKIN